MAACSLKWVKILEFVKKNQKKLLTVKIPYGILATSLKK